MIRTKSYPVSAIITLITSLAVLLFLFTGCEKDDKSPDSPKLSVSTFATGLSGPMGIETDEQGNVWVSESGSATPDANMNTHNDNGKVIVITPDGKKHDAIINLASYANVHSGELQGTVNILREGGILYVLSGDNLYGADVSKFKPGDAPLDAGTLPTEDIAAVISQISPEGNNPEHDSHPYNLTKGPGGDLYIADAGANAIIHRKAINDYSILAEIPAIPNPSFPGLGGPTVQSVPTSILYDGKDFLVTTLTGFPFPAGEAIIYKVTASGNVSIYQKGFNMLTDLAEGKNSNHLVAQYASSFNPASGFTPNSGSLIWANGSDTTMLAEGLNQPVAIKQVNDHTWYVTVLGDDSVLKITYE